MTDNIFDEILNLFYKTLDKFVNNAKATYL